MCNFPLANWQLPPIPLGTDSWLGLAVVLVALIIFIWVVARLMRRVTDDMDPAETDRQMLTAITDLHRKGDLSLEEYRSIKGQLVERLQDFGPPVRSESAEVQPAEQNSDGAEKSHAASDDSSEKTD